ncbi:MAG: hypothetical protein IJX99_00015 [Clostridia bacterium]|nr:hypothetical protein [Clostridia bacterium]
MADSVNSNVSLSTSMRNHELTMLYLKQQDLSKLSISELAQKYTDIKDEFNEAFKEQRNNKVYFG